MHFAFASPNAIGFGASTSVFGLIAAEGIFFYQNRKLFADQFKRVIGNAIFIMGANLLIGPAIGAGNWGHIGGLLGGLLFASFAGPQWEIEGIHPDYRLVDRRSVQAVIAGAATVVLIFGGLAMWGMVR
jgi:rhomboid protease GluP